MNTSHPTPQPGTFVSHGSAVSVLISTRDRGDRIVASVQSVLANTYPWFELLVVDQSTADHTEQALQPLLVDPRIRYMRSNTHGVSTARNIGIDSAHAEIVLMTDDDCEVPTDWVERMATLFDRYPSAAVVFCDVLAGSYDSAKGWILVNKARRSMLIQTLRGWRAAGGANSGISAGMGVRRAAVQHVGGFDAMLGAGSPLRSGGETDLTIRLILHGYQIYRTTETCVYHHGFRTHEQGRKLMRGYMFGVGAVCAKQVKCHGWRLIPVLFFELWRTTLKPLLQDGLALRRPRVLGRFVYLMWGFLRGLRTPVDATKQVYRAPDAAPTAQLSWDDDRAPVMRLLRRNR